MGHDEDMYCFAEEFIGSVNRVNYNQDNRLNALAGQQQLHMYVDSMIPSPRVSGNSSMSGNAEPGSKSGPQHWPMLLASIMGKIWY